MVKVSVIIPVFNTDKYLEKCLESIINQTLKDIEIICVDDGSTDNSLKILNQWAEKDNRIIIITQNHQKQGTARNKGINLAQGEYIGFVDSDDFVANDFFENLYNSATQYNAHIACASIIRKRKKSQKYRLKYNELKKVHNIDEKLEMCTSVSGDYIWNVWNKIYNKQFLIDNNILFDENIYFEDVYFTLKAIHLADSIISVPNTFYYYYVRDNSVVKSKQNKQKRDDLLISYAKMYNYCRNNNIKISKKNSYCTKVYLKFLKFVILSSKHTFQDEWITSNLKLFNLLSLSHTKKINPFVLDPLPVDLVYTWCDGNEEKLKSERNLWEKKLNISPKEFNYKCQWDDNEELKYSIRSVEKYAPWIRKIFIVTNNQRPKWLLNYNSEKKKNSPEIQIVDVADIMPKESLPTFNSQAIETCLPYIKGLSEHFLYACDDMFFNAPVEKTFFFNSEGKPIVRLQSKISPKTLRKSQYARTIIHAQNVINQKYKKLYKHAPHHCIDAYTKTLFLDCIKEFQNEFDNTTFHKFRDEKSIQRAIILYRAIATKQAVMKLTKVFGICNTDSKCVAMNKPNKIKDLNNNSIKLFCINDDNRATVDDRKQFKQFLKQKFSDKSIYEE